MAGDMKDDGAALRAQLGLSQADWARALNVSAITVKRWEEQGVDPAGLAADVIRGISSAIDDGAEPAMVGRLVRQGIGVLLGRGITSQLGIASPGGTSGTGTRGRRRSG